MNKTQATEGEGTIAVGRRGERKAWRSPCSARGVPRLERGVMVRDPAEGGERDGGLARRVAVYRRRKSTRRDQAGAHTIPFTHGYQPSRATAGSARL